MTQHKKKRTGESYKQRRRCTFSVSGEKHKFFLQNDSVCMEFMHLKQHVALWCVCRDSCQGVGWEAPSRKGCGVPRFLAYVLVTPVCT